MAVGLGAGVTGRLAGADEEKAAPTDDDVGDEDWRPRMFKRRGELPREGRDRRSVRHKCVDSDITGPHVPAEGEAQDVAVAFDRDPRQLRVVPGREDLHTSVASDVRGRASRLTDGSAREGGSWHCTTPAPFTLGWRC